MNLEVESEDVIKLMLQFLKEHNLSKTAEIMQEESGVSLNNVDDVSRFHNDIIRGRWDIVLETTQTLTLSKKKLLDLYEQVILELAEYGELETARGILRTTSSMEVFKRENPQRYLKLEHLLNKSFFDPREAYPQGTSKIQRRNELADALSKEVFTVPGARLTALLTQALK